MIFRMSSDCVRLRSVFGEVRREWFVFKGVLGLLPWIVKGEWERFYGCLWIAVERKCRVVTIVHGQIESPSEKIAEIWNAS